MKPLESLLAEAESSTTTSAGNSAPAAAPAAPAADNAGAPAAPVDAGGGKDEDWGNLSQDEDGGEAPAGKPARPAMKPAPAAAKPVAAPIPAATAPQAVATPPAPVVAAPKPGEAAPAAPAAQPGQPPAPAQPAKPAEAPAAVETPEAKAARVQAERTASDKKLNDDLVNYYKIPDEWSARLATEPELVLPQLAARLHQTVLESVRNMLDQGVPQVVQGLMHVQQRESAAKAEFYKRWPTLSKYEEQVLQAGRLFGQLNPTATPEERIERIGKIVSESLGIPIAPIAMPQGGQAPAVSAPAAFRPAGGASGSRPPAPANEFEALAEELVEDQS